MRRKGELRQSIRRLASNTALLNIDDWVLNKTSNKQGHRSYSGIDKVED